MGQQYRHSPFRLARLPAVLAFAAAIGSVAFAARLVDDPRLDRMDPTRTTIRVNDGIEQFLASPATITQRAGGAPTLPGPCVGSISNGDAPEGDTAMDVTYTPDGSRIVVAHRDSQNVVVFDAATREVLKTIPVTGSPNSVRVAADGIHAVTANVFEDSASILNVQTGVEIAVIPIGDHPAIVRITPDGATAVVGNTASSDLSLIDIATADEKHRLPGAQFDGVTSITFENGAVSFSVTPFVIAADNDTIVFPERVNNRVRFFEISTGNVTSLPTAPNPRGVAISPDGTTAVVPHIFGTQLVSVIDVPTRTVTKTIPIGADLSATGLIAINPGKTKAVVAIQNEVRVVNLITDTVSGNLFTGGPNGLLTTSDGQYCLVTGFFGALVSYASESVVANVNNTLSANWGAVSPTQPQGAMVATHFGESLIVANTNGGAGFLEEIVPTGPPPEGDRARHVAITPDGSRAAIVNILSDNVSVVDLNAESLVGIVDAGDRPSEVAITPDGTKAVVANLDSTFATIIDLGTLSATDVPISTRASQVEISPDGQYAYLAVVSNGDGVWRINLDTMSVAGPRIFSGNMGGIGFAFAQASGMTLSHDGATLVTCNSFDNNVSIIDTASWDEIARVNVGAFPVRAVFAPDDGTIYVSNRDADSVSVVANSGAASVVTGTIPVGASPYEMTVTHDGSTLYVADFLDNRVSVVDLSGTQATSTIPLGQAPVGLHVNPTGTRLYVAGGTWSVSVGPGAVFSINLFGEFRAIDTESQQTIEFVDTALPPAMLAFRNEAPMAIIPSPFGDGLSLIRPESPSGDGDGDGDVDLNDFAAFLGCFTGPRGDIGPGCEEFDFDLDADVDRADFGQFQSVFTGSD